MKIKLILQAGGEGLLELLKFKAAFPKGLTSILKQTFPNIEAIALPQYNPILSNINFYWLILMVNFSFL